MGESRPPRSLGGQPAQTSAEFYVFESKLMGEEQHFRVSHRDKSPRLASSPTPVLM